MAKILPMPKRMTQQHEELTMKLREDFDHKSWWKSVGWFWMGIGAFMLLVAVVDYATACGEEVKPMEPIKVVIRI